MLITFEWLVLSSKITIIGISILLTGILGALCAYCYSRVQTITVPSSRPPTDSNHVSFPVCQLRMQHFKCFGEYINSIRLHSALFNGSRRNNANNLNWDRKKKRKKRFLKHVIIIIVELFFNKKQHPVIVSSIHYVAPNHSVFDGASYNIFSLRVWTFKKTFKMSLGALAAYHSLNIKNRMIIDGIFQEI